MIFSLKKAKKGNKHLRSPVLRKHGVITPILDQPQKMHVPAHVIANILLSLGQMLGFNVQSRILSAKK